jgi:hypothetical protein
MVIVGSDVGSAKKMVSVNKIISHACGATFADLCIVIFLIHHIPSPEALALKKPWVGLHIPRVLLGICGEGVWNTQILILYFNQLQCEDYYYYCIVFILLEYTR